MFVQHQIKDHAVAGAVGAQGGKVVQRIFHIVLHNAVGALHPHAAHTHGSCLTGSVDAGGDLQCTVGLCAIAYHAGDVAHHVLDGAAYLVVAAAQQIGNAAGCAGGSNRCTTKVAQAAKLGLDADRDQVGKGHGAEHLLLVDVQPAGSCHNRHGSRDALIIIKKPIEQDSFSKTFLEANRKICSKNFFYAFKYRNQEYKIPCKDILYYESRGRQITIYERGGETYVFNGKLSDVEKNLEEGKIPFLRIHQSYLVNYLLIKSRTKSEVVLINGTKLKISEDKQKKFSRDYGQLLRGEINV